MSEKLQAEALAYFQAADKYFWRWAEELEVVEWQDGTTVGYREELVGILRSLVANELALPPLGSVLLLLAGCNGWADADGGLLWHQFRQYGEFLDATLLITSIETTTKLLQQVVALPPELRTGVPKQHLFREIFSERTMRSIEPGHAATLVDEWASGRLDTALQATGPASQWSDFTADLLPLRKASYRFEAPDSLEAVLRTGLDKLPEPLPELEPAHPAPASPILPLDLFEQLAQDPRTVGVARLAQHLAAALRIPLHTQGASDQPLGGVSDVTNRGNFDRLLLSELAHDDLSLLARLVNNEALYLRREEPPRQDARPRFILLDTTLRMWGVPRVFALAAALAWVRSARQARPPVPVAAVGLGGQGFSALDLESLEGVVAALELLDVAPHGGVALQAFARVSQQQAAADTLLITDAQLLHQPGFARALAEVKPALRFLLTVDRSGESQLYEYQNGHRVLISGARYDLEELLFKASAPLRRLPPLAVSDSTTPAFLQQQPAPLYLPTLGLRVLTSNTYFPRHIGVLGITNVQRVLHWPHTKYGAREILPVIEDGHYSFGDDERTVYVLVSGKSQLVFYALAVDTGAVVRLDLSAELPAGTAPTKVVYTSGYFYLWLPARTTDPNSPPVASIMVFDCKRQQLAARGNKNWPTGQVTTLSPQHVKQLINNGYNVLQRVTKVGLTDAGELLIDGQELRVVSVSGTLTHELRLRSRRPESQARAIAQVSVETFALTANKRLPFRLFRWANGSEAVLDPRGLLHLRSVNASVPEITLVLILNQPTAAWAADDSLGGTVCGSPYFTGPQPGRQMAVPEFYQQYIQRFIEHLA
ncbi:MAG: hypothetical protein ACRYF0_00590 [Janthinobacterium lividum]